MGYGECSWLLSKSNGKKNKKWRKVGEMVLLSRERNWFKVTLGEAEEIVVFVQETVTI